MTIDRKQIFIIAAGVVVLGIAAWFGWQYFEQQAVPPTAVPTASAPAASPAKSTTQAAGVPKAALKPEKLIDDVMAASGLKDQLNQFPEQIVAGVQQASKQQRGGGNGPELAAIARECFSGQGFNAAVAGALKKNFDQARLQAVLKDVSTPLAKRMLDLEKVQPGAQELAAFARGLAANPLPKERVELIQRLDAASQASELQADAAVAAIRAMATAAAGDPQKTVEIERGLDRQRPVLTQNVKNSTLLAFAFIYRQAGDSDLADYIKFYESEEGKWFTRTAGSGIVDEVKNGSTRMGERLAALYAKKGATQPAATRGDAKVRKARSRANEDARECLALATNTEVMKCAEQFR